MLKERAASLYSKGRLGYLIRVHGEWDEDQFAALVSDIDEAIVSVSGQQKVPRWMAAFFCCTLSRLLEDMSNPAFAASNVPSSSRPTYFDERVLDLVRARTRFCEH